MLASDDHNPEFVGAKNPDSALIVEFYTRPVQNNVASTKAGRAIFEDVIYIKIDVPGIKDMKWDMPARSDHKARFPLQWAHYKNKTEGDAREIGTPLSEWPVLTRSQAEEFRGLKFFTVESLANASDANINNLGMMGGMSPYALREKARAFLASAKDTALPQQQAEELAKRDAELERLRAELSRVAALVETKPAVVAAAPVEKAKKTLSPDHLAKLAAGRAKAKAAKQKVA